MKLVAGEATRGPVVSSAVVVGAILSLAATVILNLPIRYVFALAAVTIVATVGYRSLLAWKTLLALTLLVILFIPIRRYTLPGDLPFELEPYRLVVALVLGAWLTSLLIDPSVRLRRSGLEGPLLLFVFAALGSIIVNGPRVSSVESDVVKELTFFVSFLLLFYMIVGTAKTFDVVALIVKVLVGGASLVALTAIIEARTGYNVFNHLADFIPFLELERIVDLSRGGRLRVYASAQHPIALGAALVMLIPLAIYLVRSTGLKRWWIAAAMLGLGALATVSRTSVIMLAVVVGIFLWLKPLETKRLWPALLPAVLIVHFALPGTLGSLKSAFLPQGGLIEEQRGSAGQRGSGRIADLGPSLAEYRQKPFFGQGFGTRVVDRERDNAIILDNQWLHTLLETGIVGAFAWVWLFTRAIRRFGRLARDDLEGADGWLFAGITASIAAFAVGMFTYDAFSFIQVTFLVYILLAVGAALSSNQRVDDRVRRESRHMRPVPSGFSAVPEPREP